jgi:uncharacterized RDD family membrane protein YckC
MVTDLQKASLWKRISAGLFDFIMLAVLTVGMIGVLSWALGYDAQNQKLQESYGKYEAAYEAQYGVEFRISQEEYNAMTQAERENYDAACTAVEKAFAEDKDVIYQYNLVMNMTLLMTTFGLLFSVLILEFFVPLLLKNGQTLGKKIFAVALMRTDGVKVSNVQLFIRALLGKFTIELMIPVYILLMIFFNSIGIVGIAILAGILIGEVVSLITSRTNSLIHDSIAGTVAVDMASQLIFESMDERIAYIKRLHAQDASRNGTT